MAAPLHPSQSAHGRKAERRQDHLEEAVGDELVPPIVGVKAILVAHQVVLDRLAVGVDHEHVVVLGLLLDRLV